MSDFGIAAFTDEDGGYRGSTFREVLNALNANPYQRVWGRENEPPLPVYERCFKPALTLRRLLRLDLIVDQPVRWWEIGTMDQEHVRVVQEDLARLRDPAFAAFIPAMLRSARSQPRPPESDIITFREDGG